MSVSPPAGGVFSSVERAPSVSGLHLIGAFRVYQVDHIITCQQSKRRGGPKKAILQYRIVDDRQPKAAQPLRELQWKTIAVKNFSNKANICQYERNPYGTMRDREHLVVLHGARSSKGDVSNTVGVNVAGKALGQHPRFLLSSGKGETGARSTVLMYSANPYAHVELTKVWIEHKELRVTIEQVDEHELQQADPATAGRALVAFAPKYKQVYAQKEEDGETAMTDALPSFGTVSKPVALKRSATTTKWSPAVDLSRDVSHLSTASAPAKMVALPPSAMPQALIERLKRKRSFDALESAFEHHQQLQATSEEPTYKKECLESPTGLSYEAVPGFGGFEGDSVLSSYEQLMEQALVDESMLTGDESCTDIGEEADDDSLRSDDATPRVGTTPPPFLHTVSCESESDSTCMTDCAQFSMAEMACFEHSLDKYQPCQQQDAEQTELPLVPHVLASAHLQSQNPYCFAPLQLQPKVESLSLPSAFFGGSAYSHLACSPPPALFADTMNELSCRKSESASPHKSTAPRLPPLLRHPATTTTLTSVPVVVPRPDPYAHIFNASISPPGSTPLTGRPRALPPTLAPGALATLVAARK